ncbi:MAG: hypothetical protein ACLTXH_12315 [Enterobacter hormaechei]
MAVLISFLTWNYFINTMGMTWGHFFIDFLLTHCRQRAGDDCGIKTLDTSIIGAISFRLVTAIHTDFSTPLPVFWGFSRAPRLSLSSRSSS